MRIKPHSRYLMMLSSAVAIVTGGALSFPAWQELTYARSNSAAAQDAAIAENVISASDVAEQAGVVLRGYAEAADRLKSDAELAQMSAMKQKLAALLAEEDELKSRLKNGVTLTQEQMSEYAKSVEKLTRNKVELEMGLAQLAEHRQLVIVQEESLQRAYDQISDQRLPEGGRPYPTPIPPTTAGLFPANVNAQPTRAYAPLPSVAIRRGVNIADDRSREIDQDIFQLSEQLKSAETDEQKSQFKEKVKTLLESQYDLYLDQHEAPLKELEARVEKLREDFESRRKAKEDLVKLRLDTIWYNSQGLGWPGGQSSRVPGGFLSPAIPPLGTTFSSSQSFQNNWNSANQTGPAGFNQNPIEKPGAMSPPQNTQKNQR